MSLLRASAVLGTALAVTLAGCTADRPAPGVAATPAVSVGPAEGALTLVAPPGYAEEGAVDQAVDWVTPFERETGCQVTVRTAHTAQDAYERMAGGAYDGGLVPVEVAGALIDGGKVAPLNLDLIPSAQAIPKELRALVTAAPEDEEDRKPRKVYGVPNAWGADLLLFDPRKAAPASWGDVFDPERSKPHHDAILWRDTPATIGLAALYLKERRPKLKIDDPFALTVPQLDAVAEVLAAQRPHVRPVWRDPAVPVEAFATGGAAVGVGDAHTFDVLVGGGVQVAEAAAREGGTGWANAWMMGARARHPGCLYRWLDWTASPEVQRAMAEWRGVAPANPGACATLRAGFCAAYRVGDRAYLEKLVWARTPGLSCPDDKECTGWADWAKVWESLRGDG
ncbi:extracellular solute-binding protein [Actinocorallia sp. API 0066]|uniref:extracellular solute-binding protein n=1 Tax=Actinocorallia sp. API 0066 TaxID=2896846 RepID=UPI001E3B3188|nr:extracellular solute-binding protein [Actinocorallia sp. API 0066]MCD0448461.1 extracellular solute-binding protein [Actinocorallia sp. API 0066]